jgi:hypothetical protein
MARIVLCAKQRRFPCLIFQELKKLLHNVQACRVEDAGAAADVSWSGGSTFLLI